MDDRAGLVPHTGIMPELAGGCRNLALGIRDATFCVPQAMRSTPEHASAMTYRPLRLPAGADLRRALQAVCDEHGAASAFVIAGIGSLKDPRLRFAGADECTALMGSFEILTLCGTLTSDGAHLHMTVSDEHGRVVGGHVCYGNEVRTTAEILLAFLPGWRLSREFDSSTGYRELSVRAVDRGGNNGT